MSTVVADLGWLHREPAGLLRPSRLVVPFVGAGLSKAMGLPDGPEVAVELRRLATETGVDLSGLPPANRDNCLAVANEWARRQRDAETQIRNAVAEFISLAEAAAEPTVAQSALVRIDSRLCLTLNWDLGLEAAAQDQGIDFRSLIAEELQGDDLPTIVGEREELLIVHLHGSLAKPDSLVLTAGAYDQLRHNGLVSNLFTLVLNRYHGCFLGVSFDEPYLASIFHENATRTPRHVFIASQSTARTLGEGRGKVTAVEHGILTAGFRDGHYESIDVFAEWLVRAEPPPRVEATAPRGPDPDPHYVSQRLVKRPEPEKEGEEGIGVELGIALGLLDATTEEQLVAVDRCVLQGDPGTGKTTLLRNLGRLSDPDYLPIYIPLRNLDPAAGLPENVLGDWARHGEVLRDEQAPLGPEVFAVRRFYFFFDGLDEAPKERRAELARRLREIAVALPQHRYLVAARPIAELEDFDEAPWQRYLLSVRGDWADDYLHTRRVDAENLQEAVAWTSIRGGLFAEPFYLAALVELFDAGELERVADLRELILRLAEVRVEKDELLRLSAAEIIPWLRNVAFALTLSGRTSANLDELRRFPIDVPAAIGSLDELLESLINRSLLGDSSGNYIFQHRLIQEALAAEELRRLGPTEEVLAAVAPRISDRVVGARTVWTVPLGMLLAGDENWRRALRERDPLLVARHVPPDADLEERRWAASALWDYYLETRLWMHDWNDPTRRQDSEALAELLNDPELADIRDRVIDGLSVHQRQIRSNAIEVLGFTDWPDLLAATRRLLVDCDDFVVRRHAASVARLREFTSLFEPIRRRALAAKESTEVSDMTSIVLALCPREELLALAESLANRGRDVALSRGQLSRLSAAERVRYLRVLTGTESEPLSSLRETFLEVVAELRRVSPKTAEDVGYIAAVWSIEEPRVIEWLRRRPAAAVGVIDAIDSGNSYRYQVLGLLGAFSEAALRKAGADPELIAKLAQMREPVPATALAHNHLFGTESESESTGPEAKLAELLAQPAAESDATLLYNARYLSSAAAKLTKPGRHRLRRRLGRWWRDGELRKAVRRTRSGYSLSNWAAGWLFYGPAIDASLNAERWAEVAVFGLNFNDIHEWLSRHHTRAGEHRAAELCEARGIAAWSDLVAVIPGTPSRELVEAMLTHACRVDDSYKLTHLGERLADLGDLATLRRLAAISSGFAEGLLPNLAAAGDLDAQRKLLRRLRRSLARDEAKRYSERLRWLGAIHDESMIGELIACLRLAQPLEGDVYPDVIAPLRAAMEAIGGEAAIAAYDKLVNEEISGIQFLRHSREAIAQGMLSTTGIQAAAQLSFQIELPLIDAG
jgi:SIR2-like domain